jgi:hypothetical protein
VTPAEVRPHLAAAAAANLDVLERVLLETAAGANKLVWTSVTCKFCERVGRYEVSIPDHRVRLDAVEKLLQQGLGRAREAQEAPASPVPTSVDAVTSMTWADMQALATTILVDELTTLERDGGEALLRGRIANLSENQRSALAEALDAAR